MERAKAIAIAAAVAMSLTSGAIALGANLGALGFGGTTPNPVATSQVAIVAATSRVVPTAPHQSQQGEPEATELRADSATNPKD